MTTRRWSWAGVTLLVAVVAIQFVPYGRHYVIPPTISEPAWTRPPPAR